MEQKRGFTLIELLVVIAVIAILAAILFPVFAQAREKARTAVCLSNEKQISLAAMMYADDYDGIILPTAWPPGPSLPDQDRVWTATIQPYLKNGGGFPARCVLVCPSWSKEKLLKAGTAPGCNFAGSINAYLASAIEMYAHYGLYPPMHRLFGVGTQQSPLYRWAGSGRVPTCFVSGVVIEATYLVQVSRPAETVFISDGAAFRTAFLPVTANVVLLHGCYAAEMHQGGANFIFLDGHSKWIRGNISTYLSQTATGEYFRRYETYSME